MSGKKAYIVDGVREGTALPMMCASLALGISINGSWVMDQPRIFHCEWALFSQASGMTFGYPFNVWHLQNV